VVDRDERSAGIARAYKPWPFGYVTDTECGETRLAIGSCAEQREVK
jgi:hypothetical protein